MPRLSLILSVLFLFSVTAIAQTEKLKIVSKPNPSYTAQAREAGIEGKVVLRVAFLKDGKIGKIVDITKEKRDVLSSYGLTGQAIDAAKKIRFEPKKVDGVAVTAISQIEYDFDIY